jgi:uncharacterized protein (TIGR00369 family)
MHAAPASRRELWRTLAALLVLPLALGADATPVRSEDTWVTSRRQSDTSVTDSVRQLGSQPIRSAERMPRRPARRSLETPPGILPPAAAGDGVELLRGTVAQGVPADPTLALAARLVHQAGGTSVVALDLRPELLNHHGGSHGGVTMTLRDSAMARAKLSRIDHSREVVSISMHIAFLRPATGKRVATGGGRSCAACRRRHGQGGRGQGVGWRRHRPPRTWTWWSCTTASPPTR